MVVLEPDMPDWGDDDDVEEITPAIPAEGEVRLGVDLGGVLLAKLPSGKLPMVQTPK